MQKSSVIYLVENDFILVLTSWTGNFLRLLSGILNVYKGFSNWGALSLASSIVTTTLVVDCKAVGSPLSLTVTCKIYEIISCRWRIEKVTLHQSPTITRKRSIKLVIMENLLSDFSKTNLHLRRNKIHIIRNVGYNISNRCCSRATKLRKQNNTMPTFLQKFNFLLNLFFRKMDVLKQ